VAFHCVTRAELVLAAAALEVSGARADDRIEHAAIAPPDAVDLLARLGVRVVCNPGFLRERGDDYAAHVEAAELPWLVRCRGFLDAGVPLGAGTDAPFGAPDPWRSMQAAVDRLSESGVLLGPGERLSPEAALALFTSPAEAPGDPPRGLAPGARADLCLLDRPWRAARERLCADGVAATLVAGRVIWARR
jgi:predicted amidohydrolase YtcJ